MATQMTPAQTNCAECDRVWEDYTQAVIAHLKRLGISAIELLPVHPIADEPRLVRAGLRNYWGYNSINFFALEPRSKGSCGR